MRVSPDRLRKHLDKYQVPYELSAGWNSSSIDPYQGKSDFQGIVLHHTAGIDSEAWVLAKSPSYPYKPYRACHFLIKRDGTVLVVSGSGAYHAGLGGPAQLTKAVTIPKNSGNSRLYGIEIESLGTSARIDGKKEGMTKAQAVSTAMLCAALLSAMSPVPGGALGVNRVIRHRDWTSRKTDTRQDLDWWRTAIRIARANRSKPKLAMQKVSAWVLDNKSGHLQGKD